MKRSVKRAWLTALRSGEYTQGRGRLCRTYNGVDRFCCLGVLVDIACDGDWERRSGGEWAYGGDELEPTWRVRRDVGLSKELMDALIRLNDVDRLSFGAIADWVDANV